MFGAFKEDMLMYEARLRDKKTPLGYAERDEMLHGVDSNDG